MTDHQNAKLRETVKEIVARVTRFQGRSLGEQNTKASLIEPVLEALGWDIRDPDEVHHEYKPTPKDNPVDYALSLLRTPRLFVEAKGLGDQLDDRKWIIQILTYATGAGVVWCVLTDGNEYRFYNSTAAVDAEEKLFRRIRLSDVGEEEAVRTLSLISRGNLEDNILDVLWNAFFVDRQVKQTLRELVTTPAKGLVRLIRRKASKLTPKEIGDSLRRLDFRIESPTDLSGQSGPTGPAKLKRQRAKAPLKERRREHPSVSLADLISASLISPPLTLFRKYKGKLLEATLLPDGGVECEGKHFDSCSTAADYARSTVTGRRMHTNGWVFWQHTDAAGKKVTLADTRGKFLAMKGVQG